MHTPSQMLQSTPYAESIDFSCQNRELKATYEQYFISFPWGEAHISLSDNFKYDAIMLLQDDTYFSPQGK